MTKLLTAAGVAFGIAIWFLLFVILGLGLGTAFIAAGCALAAGLTAAAMVSGLLDSVLDTPLTAPGLLLGIAAFAILEVVLSVPMWVGVITGLGVVGLYDLCIRAFREHRAAPQPEATVAPAPPGVAWHGNGHDRSEAQAVGAG